VIEHLHHHALHGQPVLENVAITINPMWAMDE
jgi:hypothetical protein